MHLDDDAVLWSAGENDRADRPMLVMMHGYASNEGDLFSLAPYLPLEAAIASLRGPLTQPPGYAWYPLTGRASGRVLFGTDLGPAELNGEAGAVAEAVETVGSWIEAHAGTAPVALLGFSQGGAMALELMRARPERYACAVVLSGFAIERPVPGDAGLTSRMPPVFWGRGADDTVVSAAAVASTADWMRGHVAVEEHVYPGLGHGVERAELSEVSLFLRAHLR